MPTRSWKDYAELVGLFALVVSIVLLTFEIQQTRLAIKGEAFLARAAIGAESDIDIAASDYLPAIEVKYVAEELESLTPEERERFVLVANAAKTRHDAYFYQYELGLLEEDFYQYFLLPGISYYKKRWIELGMVREGDTRPSVKAVIDQSPDVSFWDQNN